MFLTVSNTRQTSNNITTCRAQNNLESFKVFSFLICPFSLPSLFKVGLRPYWQVIGSIFILTTCRQIIYKDAQLVLSSKRIFQTSSSVHTKTATTSASIPLRLAMLIYFLKSSSHTYSASKWMVVAKLHAFHLISNTCTLLETKLKSTSGIWSKGNACKRWPMKAVSRLLALILAETESSWQQEAKWVLSTCMRLVPQALWNK